MNISTEQKTAKQWAKALVKLNSAEPGTVQICYQDGDGNKQVGFLDIFDLEIVDGERKMTFGAFLSLVKAQGLESAETLANALKTIAEMKSEIASLKSSVEEIRAHMPGLTAL